MNFVELTSIGYNTLMSVKFCSSLKLLVVSALSLLLVGGISSSQSAPVSYYSQTLDPRNSSIKFEVNTPNNSFTGSFSDFSGKMNFDPQDVTLSQISLSLNLESVRLPPEQILPALLVQTVLQRLKNKTATFKSTDIKAISKKSLKVTGIVSWQGKDRTTTVPVEIVSITPALSKIKCLVSGNTSSAKDGEADIAVAALGGKANGRALTQLAFVAR